MSKAFLSIYLLLLYICVHIHATMHIIRKRTRSVEVVLSFYLSFPGFWGLNSGQQASVAMALSMETPPYPKSTVLMSQRLGQSKSENHSSSQFIDNYGTCRDTQLSLFCFLITVHVSKYEFCVPKMKFRGAQPPQRTLHNAYTTGLPAAPSQDSSSYSCHCIVTAKSATSRRFPTQAPPASWRATHLLVRSQSVHRFW